MAKELSSGFNGASAAPDDGRKPRKKGREWIPVAAVILAVVLIGGVFGGGRGDDTADADRGIIPVSEPAGYEDGTQSHTAYEPDAVAEPETDAPGSVQADASGQQDIAGTEEPAAFSVLDANLLTEKVMNGAGTEPVGERAWVFLAAAELSGLSQEDLVRFAREKVDGSGYNWVSIIADNGRGIVFAGSNISLVEYGVLDDMGRIEETVGYLRLSGDEFIYTDAAEAARLEAERLAQEEADRLEAERSTEEDRVAAEAAAKAESDRKAAEEAAAKAEADRKAAEEAASQEPAKYDWVLNTCSGVYHYPSCRAVKRMNDENRREINATKEEMREKYTSCGICHS